MGIKILNRKSLLLDNLSIVDNYYSNVLHYLKIIKIAVSYVKGIYNYLPLGVLIIEKLKIILRRENNKFGAEICTSSLISTEMFFKSNRTKKFKNEILNINNKVSLSPTGEEIIALLTSNRILSFKSLPIYVYQITNKYRNEVRPRNFILRTLEFLMKDGYYFTACNNDMVLFYKKMIVCYLRIINKLLELPVYIVKADSSSMNAIYSHEFICEGSVFECKFYKYIDDLNIINNININNIDLDILHSSDSNNCKKIPLKLSYGMEIGHIFNIGEYFTKIFNGSINNNIYMGSFGIGIARILVAYTDFHIKNAINNGKRFVWKHGLSPIDYVILLRNEHELDLLREVIPKLLFKNNDYIINILLDDNFFKPFNVRMALYKMIGVANICYYSKENTNNLYKFILLDAEDNINVIPGNMLLNIFFNNHFISYVNLNVFREFT